MTYYEDVTAIEACIVDITLTETVEYASAYVAGWLEVKCSNIDFNFSEDEPILDCNSADFIITVSRGSLKIPHLCTYAFVKIGLRFMKIKKNIKLDVVKN